MTERIDLLVMGPAGYNGYSPATWGKRGDCRASRLGGTCLNRGCIPTKALLESAHFYAGLSSAGLHGVELEVKGLDYGQVIKNKDQIVQGLVKGLEFLLDKRRIRVLAGQARFLPSGEVQVGEDVFQADHVLVATGTEPLELPGLEADGQVVVNSDQLLDRPALPESLVIVGGGVIATVATVSLPTEWKLPWWSCRIASCPWGCGDQRGSYP